MLYVDGRVYFAHEREICDGVPIDLYYKVIETSVVGKDDGMGIVATHGGAGKDATNVMADLRNPHAPNPSCAYVTNRDAP